MSGTAATPVIVLATCASCGLPKLEKNPCAVCGGRENVPGSRRTPRAR